MKLGDIGVAYIVTMSNGEESAVYAYCASSDAAFQAELEANAGRKWYEKKARAASVRPRTTTR